MLFKEPMMRIPKLILTVSMYCRTHREQDSLAKTITEVVAKILNIHKKTGIILFQEPYHGNCMFLISVSNAE
jgi:phenylpyruvate tautomerase PptA (4-oxalocrotonate tautomerase family)